MFAAVNALWTITPRSKPIARCTLCASANVALSMDGYGRSGRGGNFFGTLIDVKLTVTASARRRWHGHARLLVPLVNLLSGSRHCHFNSFLIS